MLFWLKKKIDGESCSYFKILLFLHLVLIKFYAFVVAVIKVDL